MTDVMNVLLIDDDDSFADEFIGLASYHNIAVRYYPQLADIVEDSSRLDHIDFIVLDAHCIIDEENTNPDFDFVPTALREIESIERKRNKHIPKCINTGYPEETKLQRYRKTIQIFEKSTQQEELFAYIKELVQNSDIYQIKQQHRDVFEIFSKNFLDNEIQELLVGLLKPIPPVVDVATCKAYAANIRSIQEAIYKTIHKQFPHILNEAHFKPLNDMIDFNKAKFTLSAKSKENGATKHDKERDLQGSDIENLSNSIYWICGNIIHYNPKERIPYQVSRYTIQSLIFALMEQLLWFKQFMQQQTSKR